MWRIRSFIEENTWFLLLVLFFCVYINRSFIVGGVACEQLDIFTYFLVAAVLAMGLLSLEETLSEISESSAEAILRALVVLFLIVLYLGLRVRL